MDFSNPWLIGGAVALGIVVIAGLVISSRSKKDPYAPYYDDKPVPRPVGKSPALGMAYGSGQQGDPIREEDEPTYDQASAINDGGEVDGLNVVMSSELELTPEMEEKVEQTDSVEELLSELDTPTPGDLVEVIDTKGIYRPERFNKPLKVDLVTKHKSPQVRLVDPDTGSIVETLGMKRVKVVRK